MSKAYEKNYDLYEELNSLSQLLDDYQTWFASITHAACFASRAAALPIPSLFIESLSAIPENEINTPMREALAVLHRQHHDLQDMSEEITKAAAAGNTASADKFIEFSKIFQTFMKGLQRTCQALILEEWGLDVLTGLKNKRAMDSELGQEMERLSRHGQSFSLALVVIDDFDEILKALGRDEADQVIKRAAGFVRTSLRSFDGAYNMGHGEFVLSLKQASISGGQKALERLRDELEKSDVTYRIDTQYKKITMSCCVAEPLPDDDLHLLLGNLRADLGMQEKEAGTVLTYFEMSPLQQFVKTGQKD